MKKTILKSILLVAGVAVLSYGVQAQQMQPKTAYSGIVLPVKNGSVVASLKGKAIGRTEIAQNLNQMLGLSEKHSFVQVSEKKDKLGITHIAYQQYFNGILVDGGKILAHFKNGLANSINGYIAPIGNLQTQKALSEEKAVLIAKSELGIVTTLTSFPSKLVIAVIAQEAGDGYSLAYKIRIYGKKADKTISKADVYVDANNGKVIKKINLIHTLDVQSSATTVYSGVREITSDNIAPSEYILRDNARNISTMDFSKAKFTNNGIDGLLDFRNNTTTWDLVPTLDSVSLLVATDTNLFPSVGNWFPGLVLFGTDLDAFPEQGPIFNFSNQSAAPIHFPNVGYSLLNPPYLAGITAFDTDLDTSGAAFFNITQADITLGTHDWSDITGNSGTYSINMQANPALDVHWGMEQTYDFYKNEMGRNSYDDQGSEIMNFVNAAFAFTGTQAQAAAIGDGLMVYGLGDRVSSNAFVTIDVTGHEFTHLVTGNNGNGGLNYEGESGALNESFSDIFGAAIEFYAKGQQANWDIGEGIILGGSGMIRSMSNPKIMNNPDTYEGEYWVDPSSSFDGGGVHYNSGIQNKWFYLLCEGGSGTNDKGDDYNVTAIGREKAEQIAYSNLINYLTPTAKYIDAYNGSLLATEDLYSDTSDVYVAVKEAWYAVGIGEKDSTTAIANIDIVNGDLKLYPNPTTGKVNISSNLSQDIDAQIINIVGVPLMNIKVSKGVNPIDISALSKGVYMIRYNTGAKGYVQKLSVL